MPSRDDSPSSSSDFERIAPADLGQRSPLGGKTSTTGQPSRTGVTLKAVLAGLVGLMALAALLLIGLPWLMQRPTMALPTDPVAASDAVVIEEAVVTPTAEPLAPAWDDPAVLRARQSAQQVAEALPDRIAALERLAVTRWAATPFAAAMADRDRAAAAFAARDFVAADAVYRAVDAVLQTLELQAPQQLQSALSAANTAIDNGQRGTATEALSLAAAMAAEDPAVQKAQARLAVLDDVAAQLNAAQQAEQRGDPAAAEQAYRAARTLDAEHPGALAGLNRLIAAREAERFQRALGTALEALDGGRLEQAATALDQAQALRPGERAVSEARARLTRLRREADLVAQLRRAVDAEAAESWADAEQAFAAALQLDGAAAAAQAGLNRVRPRRALAERLDTLIAQPQRLAAATVRDEAAALLREAAAVQPAGPEWQQRMDRLRVALVAASTPVPVTLRSDQRTEVTIFRVGAQGRFDSRQIELLPGRYVAVGARPGFRDVRVEFEVAAGPSADIWVRCEERL